MPQTTANINLDSRFFCLFKGDPGCGKSIAAASYPGKKDNPKIGPYFMDNDGRMKSVINYWRPRGREFEYDRFGSFMALNDQLKEFYAFGCPYYTIVYDGITTGGDQILSDMIETRDTSAKKTGRAGIEFLQIEDYNGESRGLSIIINNLKAISFRHGTNVIMTAHVIQVESTDLKGVTTVSRSLLTAGRKVAAKLPVHFDECYHFDVQTGMSMGPDDMPKYTVITRNVGFDWAKTALPIPTRIDFTNLSLYDVIMEHLAESQIVQAVNDPAAAELVVRKESW